MIVVLGNNRSLDAGEMADEIARRKAKQTPSPGIGALTRCLFTSPLTQP
jgi:hypothetical protein